MLNRGLRRDASARDDNSTVDALGGRDTIGVGLLRCVKGPEGLVIRDRGRDTVRPKRVKLGLLYFRYTSRIPKRGRAVLDRPHQLGSGLIAHLGD